MSHEILLADLIVAAHFGIVMFVLLGQLGILLGILRGWTWIERPGFRWAHVGVMTFVAVQGALGQLCPLTIWEFELREAAGQTGSEGSFIGRLLHDLLYIEPGTVSQATLERYYVAFALVVILCMVAVPPRRRSRGLDAMGQR